MYIFLYKMTEEALMKELRSLRSDIDQMNDRVVRLRYGDFKEIFVEQMRLTLGQEGRKSYETNLARMDGSSRCGQKGPCMSKLQGSMDLVMEHLDAGEVDEALQVLDATEKLLCGPTSPCLDDLCSSSAIETVQKVRMLLSFYQGLGQRLNASSLDISKRSHAKEVATPEAVEAALSPLSNSWRLKIMLMLKEGGRSLSEISRSLGMRTGHLQFHIRSLRDAGYITSDKRTKAYSLTNKGEKAIEGAMRLASNL